MAKRRMLSIPIVETDKFYRLSSAAQALYLHLNMNADDDGIVDKVKLILKVMHVDPKNYRTLIKEGYVIELDDGLAAITHWHQHNRLKKDRYIPGEYQEQLASLTKDKNDRYFKVKEAFYGDICAPQERIGKDSIGKERKAEDSLVEDREEKEEEKEIIKETINHSFIHTVNNDDCIISNNQPDTETENTENLFCGGFLNSIRLYIMKNYNTIDDRGFISHYSSKNWRDENGKLILDSYADYVDRWMSEK